MVIFDVQWSSLVTTQQGPANEIWAECKVDASGEWVPERILLSCVEPLSSWTCNPRVAISNTHQSSSPWFQVFNLSNQSPSTISQCTLLTIINQPWNPMNQNYQLILLTMINHQSERMTPSIQPPRNQWHLQSNRGYPWAKLQICAKVSQGHHTAPVALWIPGRFRALLDMQRRAGRRKVSMATAGPSDPQPSLYNNHQQLTNY